MKNKPIFKNGMADWTGPFDKRLNGTMPKAVRAATVFVNDTLEICATSAEQVFGDQATPELTLAIYDRVIAIMKKEDIDDITA